MKGRVILHIGLHKTATTYLQYEYFPRLKNVMYAHGNSFFVPWKNQVPQQDENMLLSYEGFSGIAWNEDWKKGIPNNHHWMGSFTDNIISLQRFFPDARIIAVFRRPGDLLLSMYKQYVQEGGYLSLNDFYGDKGVIRKEDLSFENRISLLKNNFHKVHLLNYHLFKEQGDLYLDEFFKSELNLETRIKTTKALRANQSISGAKVEYLRRINPYYQKLPLRVRKVIRYSRWSPRDILQKHLAAWRPKDSPRWMEIQSRVNEENRKDWDFFLTNQWKKHTD